MKSASKWMYFCVLNCVYQQHGQAIVLEVHLQGHPHSDKSFQNKLIISSKSINLVRNLFFEMKIINKWINTFIVHPALIALSSSFATWNISLKYSTHASNPNFFYTKIIFNNNQSNIEIQKILKVQNIK